MDDRLFENVIGSTVQQIFIDETCLVFVTNKGDFNWIVEGDCCSWSYFHDFLGVKKLLAGNPIIEINELPTRVLPYEEKETWNEEKETWNDYIQVYGYEFVTEDPIFGEVTSVVSFRNSSNGYYGGWMLRIRSVDRSNLPELTDDFVGD